MVIMRSQSAACAAFEQRESRKGLGDHFEKRSRSRRRADATVRARRCSIAIPAPRENKGALRDQGVHDESPRCNTRFHVRRWSHAGPRAPEGPRRRVHARGWSVPYWDEEMLEQMEEARLRAAACRPRDHTRSSRRTGPDDEGPIADRLNGTGSTSLRDALSGVEWKKLHPDPRRCRQTPRGSSRTKRVLRFRFKAAWWIQTLLRHDSSTSSPVDLPVVIGTASARR